jgi:hypothetical protein
MRTDLISATLVHDWLSANAPDLARQWPLEPGDEVLAFTARVKTMLDNLEGQFAMQNALARAAIETWSLDNVALLAGGTPTPLSPRPEQLAYYTDANPDVLAEAERLGYRTMQVNVKNPEELKLLHGVETVIGTGLFHFLKDPEVSAVLEHMADAGFSHVVFNNADAAVDPDLIAQWSKLGATLYPRSIDAMVALLPDRWVLEGADGAAELVKTLDAVGPILGREFSLSNVFLISRA